MLSSFSCLTHSSIKTLVQKVIILVKKLKPWLELHFILPEEDPEELELHEFKQIRKKMEEGERTR